MDDEEDDDGDEEEEEEEEENDNSEDYDGNDHESKGEPLKSPSQSGSHIYTAIYDFKAEQEGDLSVKVRLSVFLNHSVLFELSAKFHFCFKYVFPVMHHHLDAVIRRAMYWGLSRCQQMTGGSLRIVKATEGWFQKTIWR